MKRIAMAAAAVCISAPAFATTYHFDYSVGSSTGGNYYDRESNGGDTQETGDMVVTGFIETDGTIGTVTAANILSWEFSISGEEESLTISSTPTFGDYSFYGTFDATPDTLTATGVYSIFEHNYVFNSEGYDEEYILGKIWGGASSSGIYDAAQIRGYDQTCMSGGCYDTTYTGEYGFTYSNTTAFVGTVSPVPLPAGFPLLLAGLGGLAVIRRKRR